MTATRRSWVIGGVVTLATAALLLAWTYHWLGDSKYGGVATIDETINRRTEAPTQEITSSVTISQTFVASDDDLTEVRVFLATYMRRNTSSLRFTLSDESGKVIATAVAPAASILDNAYRGFTFEPIADSRGRMYEVTITSPNGRPGNAFAAWIGNCDCYPAGELSINGDPLPDRELAMRVSYHHENVVTWRELLDRMSQYKPYVFNGPGLVLLGGFGMLFSLSALGVLTASVARRESQEQEEFAKPVWIAAAVVVAVIAVLVTGAYEGI